MLQQTGNREILQHQAVLSLAFGSSGDAIASDEQLQAIPPELYGFSFNLLQMTDTVTQ